MTGDELKRETRNRRWLFGGLCVVLTLLITLCTGCSFLLPGRDVAEAMRTTADTHWTADGSLTIAENTTSETITVVAEGTDLEAEWDPSTGHPIRISKATNILTQYRSPSEAAAAHTRLAEQNQIAFGRLIDLAVQAIPLLAARRGPTTQPVVATSVIVDPGPGAPPVPPALPPAEPPMHAVIEPEDPLVDPGEEP